MDALLDIVGALKLTGGIFLDAEFTAPWCVTAKVGPEDCSPVAPPPHSIIAYHYVSAGGLVLQVGARPPVEARAGDIIVLPRNDAHTLASAVGLPAVSADQLVQPGNGSPARIVHGGGGEQTRVLCGFLGGDRHCELVTGLLPAVLKLSVADGATGKWIESSLRFAAGELSAGPGQSTTVVARLAGLLFLEAVRRHLGSLPADQGGWSAGLRDPVVGRALALLHGHPERRWTTEMLAREVGLSRSGLAQRFTKLVGDPPMRYLASARLHTAARRLAESREAVARIAFEAGYDSEAAFARAFKRKLGLAPAAWRRQQASN